MPATAQYATCFNHSVLSEKNGEFQAFFAKKERSDSWDRTFRVILVGRIIEFISLGFTIEILNDVEIFISDNHCFAYPSCIHLQQKERLF